jgi:hypothetical protein
MMTAPSEVDYHDIQRVWREYEAHGLPFHDAAYAVESLAEAFLQPQTPPAPPHADLWNIAGGDIDDSVRRSALLDRYCAAIGRDPAVQGSSSSSAANARVIRSTDAFTRS